MINFFQKILYTAFLLLIIFNFTNQAQASIEVKNTFPRLANYFLKWEISDYEAESLAKWDLLILDMEVQENSPEALKKIRRLNPDVIILAYITAQEIMDDFKYYHLAHLRPKLKEGINDSWYLKDEGGNKISNWPGTYMLNLSNKSQTNQRGQRFNDYLPEFVANNIKAAGLWDGVFYDNTWGDLAWVNKTDIDLDKIYSQAMYLYKNGFQFFFDKEEIKKIELENKKFLKTPEEYDLIEMLFEHPCEKCKNVFYSASEVLEYIKQNAKLYKNVSVEQIGKALVSQGYKKRTKQKKYELRLKNTILNVA